MANQEAYNGAINQALYFARLLAEQADLVVQAEGAVPFHRQRQQCFCEASLDALYRALCFLVAAEIDQSGAASSTQARSPDELVGELEAAARLHPTPALAELRRALLPGGRLAPMLEAWRSSWQLPEKRENNANVLHTEQGLSAAECLAWRDILAELFASGRAQGAEY